MKISLELWKLSGLLNPIHTEPLGTKDILLPQQLPEKIPGSTPPSETGMRVRALPRLKLK